MNHMSFVLLRPTVGPSLGACSMLLIQDASNFVKHVVSDAGATVSGDAVTKLLVKVDKLLEPEAL